MIAQALTIPHRLHRYCTDEVKLVAQFVGLRDTTGTPGLVALTHGHLLYTAWALSLVTTLAPEEVLLRGLSRFLQGWWWPAAGS